MLYHPENKTKSEEQNKASSVINKHKYTLRLSFLKLKVMGQKLYIQPEKESKMGHEVWLKIKRNSR